MCFLFFYFIKISKFALPGVMLMYERTSKERKKDGNLFFFLNSICFDKFTCTLKLFSGPVLIIAYWGIVIKVMCQNCLR